MYHREALCRLTVAALNSDDINTLSKAAGVDDQAVLVAGLTIDHLTHHIANDNLLQAFGLDAEHGVGRIREQVACRIVLTNRSHLDADVVITAIGPSGE